MAIKKDIVKTVDGFAGTVVAKDVYIKVVSISGNKEMMEVLLNGTCDNSVVFSQSYLFTPTLDGENFIAQAYEHLKTLPEFSDAVDC